MTPDELKEILKPHGIHVYPDTGGIYTADFLYFVGSISVADFTIKPTTISKIILEPGNKQKVEEAIRAVQAVCAIHGIEVTGVY